jgi:CubicO group peptidase (beta-lactamase class C family)
MAVALRALRIVSALALAAVPPVFGAHAGTDARFAGLGEYIERVRQEWQVPGTAVGVIVDGEVAYAQGFGAREIGKMPAVDERSLFEIGSLTKAFTATALALLVEEGRIGWDDPVVRHLPPFRLSDPAIGSLVTIRDLVAHRTGYEGGMSVVRPMTSADILREADRLKAVVPFRDEVLYSNSMYSIAGEVVAAVSGTSWAEFVQRRLLGPLGMAGSGASVDLMELWDAAHLAPSMYGQAPAGRAGIEDAPGENVAMPHYHTAAGVRALPWQISLKGGDASGSMVSNLEDVLSWTRFNLGDGITAAGARLLQPATLEELHRPQHIMRHAVSRSHEMLATLLRRVNPTTQPDAYAMGWFSQDYRGMRLLSHGGALLGGMSLIAMVPERGAGVVVLANSYGKDGSGLFNDAVAMHALDVVLGEKPYDWNGELAKIAAAREAEEHASEVALRKGRLRGTRPSLPLDRYVGEYENAQFGKVRIARAGGGLRLSLPGVLDWPLEHWHNDTFRMQISTSGVPIFPVFTRFEIDTSGRIASFDAGWVLLGDAFGRRAR